MENDIMFGKPRSRFYSLFEGEEAYKKRDVTADMYLIQSPILPIEGELSFQIKEIEPESSSIYHLSLDAVRVNDNEELLVKSDFSGLVKVTEVEHGIRCFDASGQDITSKICINETGHSPESLLLETGDYIDVIYDGDISKDNYLVLGSWYRDWTLGEVYSKAVLQATKSPFLLLVSRTALRIQAVAAMIAMFWSAGLNRHDQGSSLLSDNFGFSLKSAHAEVPQCGSCDSCGGGRSLVVAQIMNDVPVPLDIIEPRYAMPSSVAIKINPQVLNGECRLRITATKKHKVSRVSLVKARDVREEEIISTELSQVFHHRDGIDYFKDLGVKDNMMPMRTLPSDVVTIKFRLAQKGDTSDIFRYVLKTGGVYAPSSRGEQSSVGDWVNKLDVQALDFLADVYKQSRTKTR
jgi:hypothetical protein